MKYYKRFLIALCSDQNCVKQLQFIILTGCTHLMCLKQLPKEPPGIIFQNVLEELIMLRVLVSILEILYASFIQLYYMS